VSFPRFPNSRERRADSGDKGKIISWPHLPAVPEVPQTWRERLRRLLPGLVTGAADADPSLVLTATVVGATFRYSLLWVVILCVPFLLTVFSVSARIGHETRRGLVDLLRSHYGRRAAIICAGFIVLINTAMIVADLMAVSDALSIILDQRRIFFVALVAFAVWYVLIFRNYEKITNALAIMALPLFAYVASAIRVKPDVQSVLYHSVVPHWASGADFTAAVIAIFGSLLTPYVIVWQTSSRREHAHAGYEHYEAEHRMGTFVTTLLCFSVMIAAGTVLYGKVSGDLTTRLAAQALTPAAGETGSLLFAIGIIGAGLVALPVLVASLCYSIAEAAEWKHGLSEYPWEAKRFYVLITAALFIAASLNFIHINPVKALYWSQILAGITTVPILIFILMLSNDRRVMRTVNSGWQNFWIGAASGGLVAMGLLVLWWKLTG
jgi:Mn2+/Fe2+ NRAMP family transporter